ncbi:MAG: hypothetical protein Q8P05_00020 [Candidatus Diapherotrites archaeon]|nr:hypothetical protein [Candidatus Diapherotrites archaeon]MDZ4256073.1 hypothetical protein [archaeon]
MSDENATPKKGKWKKRAGWAVVLFVLGLVVGSWMYPMAEPYINPNRANMIEQIRTMETQNRLLKGQVDCLVDHLRQGKADTALEVCT